MKNKILTTSFITAYALLGTASFAEEVTLEDISVTSDLRQISKQKIAASVDVMNSIDLQDKGATHFEDILLEIPNVNFSGQSSRPRHIQIRGMGERDDYTGAPNASVGMMIDGIDFSGIGMAGSLFDVKQVEVLKGPQSTRYGASAIAGLINIQSNDPSQTQEGLLEVTVGTKGLIETGLVLSGPLGDEETSPLYRVSIQKHKDNGFYENAYLGRDDTNGRDELNLRAKVNFRPSDDFKIDVTFLHANLDNGYDAWSLDNTFTTLSDEPGKDTQKTTAAAIHLESTANNMFTFVSNTSISASDMIYAYDGDWAYPGYHTTGDNTYSYSNDKEHNNITQEFRFSSTDDSKLFNDSTSWLAGLYGSKLKEKNHTRDNYGTNLQSNYEVTKLALFGQLDYEIAPKTILSAGARVENFSANYDDSNQETFTPKETMYGGNISLTHELSDNTNIYALISQGYKAGGFNMGLPNGSSPDLLNFNKETATNYEVGYKFKTEVLSTSVSAFYTDRKNPQFTGYTYVGNNYAYYTENFDKATNYGIEADFNWKATENLDLFGALGLLKTSVEGTSKAGTFVIDGREQPHAPNYQYSLGAKYRSDNGIYTSANVRGMDDFYFDTVHNEKSEAYTVVDARAGYEAENWEVYLWGKNLFDERYATRGYYFANEPTYSIDKQYIRLGDGRQIGLTTRYNF